MISVDMPNNLQARRVLIEFKKIVRALHPSKEHNGYIRVNVYTNCREQGFHVREHFVGGLDTNRSASFSECRNSDQITVYVGNASDFEFNTNIASEDVYQNCRYFFPCGAYQKAAQFIYDWIVKGKVKHQR